MKDKVLIKVIKDKGRHSFVVMFLLLGVILALLGAFVLFFKIKDLCYPI
jgi:hypothetical protein